MSAWAKAWRFPGASKYGADRQDFNGRMYHSKAEARYAAELELRRKAGDIASWKPQKLLRIYLEGEHLCDYLIDFEVVYPTGRVEYVEVKGFATAEWRLKWKAAKIAFGKDPNVSFLLVPA